MPLFAGQLDNVAQAEELGCDMSVSVKKLDTLAKDVARAIKKVLLEPNFSANAARITSIMRVHRLQPAELAAGGHDADSSLKAKAGAFSSCCSSLHAQAHIVWVFTA